MLPAGRVAPVVLPRKGPKILRAGEPHADETAPETLRFSAHGTLAGWYHTNMRLGGMVEAVRELDPPADPADLAEALRVRDQLDAKIALGIAAFDQAALWELDQATSAVAWLRARGLATGDAVGLVKAGRRASEVPALADAWCDGRLAGGQVKAIVANVSDKTADLFAEHAPELVPTLEGLGVAETTRVMQVWRARADALLDDGAPAEPERSLHASETFEGRTELKGSFDSAPGAAIRTALRTAETADDEATGRRTAAQRRADALGDICRFFLDHQDSITEGRRHRPHLNVIVDLDDVFTNAGGGATVDGSLLDPDAIRVLLCDANLHRVVTDSAGRILDYGRSQRTAPQALFTALVLRDGHCRLVPGCDRGPAWTDAHHVVAWEDGGETSLDNMVLACSRHHHLLHRQHWRQSLARDGTLTIETPDGRTWTTHARGTIPLSFPHAS